MGHRDPNSQQYERERKAQRELRQVATEGRARVGTQDVDRYLTKTRHDVQNACRESIYRPTLVSIKSTKLIRSPTNQVKNVGRRVRERKSVNKDLPS